jgi:predicted Zn-dependent protease
MKTNLRILAAALAVAAGLAACSTNPITGRKQLIGLVSEAEAIQGSAQAYRQMMAELDRKKQLEKSTPDAEHPRVKKVQEITDRLIAQAIQFRPDAAGWRWEVQVINDPKTVNAFCMAGGKMAIYTGMFEQLKITDDELAQVMGHEIAHALLDHTRERMSVARSTSLGVGLLGAATGVGGGSLGGQAMDMAAAVAITLPNSREGESEADNVGTRIASRAGYDPKAAVTLWEKMAKLGKGPSEFLSTHPSPENRAARLKELAAQLEPEYRVAKANRTPAQRYVNISGGLNERVVKPAEGANEKVVKPAPTSAK